MTSALVYVCGLVVSASVDLPSRLVTAVKLASVMGNEMASGACEKSGLTAPPLAIAGIASCIADAGDLPCGSCKVAIPEDVLSASIV